jgi:hypothetical protein
MWKDWIGTEDLARIYRSYLQCVTDSIGRHCKLLRVVVIDELHEHGAGLE